MKLLSFVPEKIHAARESYNNHEIVAVETSHSEEPTLMEIVPDLTDSEENKQAEEVPVKDINAERLEKRYEKVASLIAKWVEAEKYTTPGINIKDVATQMGTNSNYLSVYLNKVLDVSFATWLNTLRIDKSKEYLCGNQRLSIEECGIKVGYTSLYNYSRWFKTITGMSPSEWRKNQCNNKLS